MLNSSRTSLQIYIIFNFPSEPCLASPCRNSGRCSADPGSVLGYSCQCVSGWSGPRCSTRLNPCDANPCQRGSCSSIDSTLFRCNCPPGYTGTRCQIRKYCAETVPCKEYCRTKNAPHAYLFWWYCVCLLIQWIVILLLFFCCCFYWQVSLQKKVEKITWALHLAQTLVLHVLLQYLVQLIWSLESSLSS